MTEFYYACIDLNPGFLHISPGIAYQQTPTRRVVVQFVSLLLCSIESQ